MEQKIIIDRYVSPLGDILIGDYQGQLCLCDWAESPHRAAVDRRIRQRLDVEMEEGKTKLTDRAAQELAEYFSQQRKVFDLPIMFCGTYFQCEVWDYLLSIPWGERINYGALARGIRRPRATRAVASAVGANAMAVIVPCHRVVPTSGDCGEYSGGRDVKRRLLELERP